MKSEPLKDPLELPPDDHRPWLSALADGDADAVERACGLWRDEAQARQTWHAYHLIGDVLRSEELATSPWRDAAFLAGVRQRLAAEPVVLAPAVPARRRQPWRVPAAMAAGFMAVAGVLVLTQVGQPQAPSAGTGFASAASPVGNGTTLVTAPVRVAPQTQFVSDPRLNEFLRAHQAARGGLAVAAPGGLMRRVDAAVPASPER
jgi:sigma-E factor negative regulatory protein RseA